MTVCATNAVRGMHCVEEGVHLETCDGWVPRPGPRGEWPRCTGCEPRESQDRMFVCRSCYARVVSALAAIPRLVQVLRRYDRFVSPETDGRSATSFGHIPIPASHLAADELERLARLDTSHASQRVSTPEGAVSAVTLALAVEAAKAMFPTQETPHRMNRHRCPKCGLLSLRWVPASAYGGDVMVECAHGRCRHRMSQHQFERLADVESGTKRKRPIDDDDYIYIAPWEDRPTIEVFDATNPEHLKLIGVDV